MANLDEQLPDAYARALALDQAGSPTEVIAAAADVPVESVPALLAIATAKAARIAAASDEGSRA